MTTAASKFAPMDATTPQRLTIGAGDRLEVSHNRRQGTWSLQLQLNPGSRDEMWETINYAYTVATEVEALRLRAKIRAAGVIDLRHWTWCATLCSPLSFMQQRPCTAFQREVIAARLAAA